MAKIVYICFWFDVEDHIDLDSHDAVKLLAQLLYWRGARGTFKLVGKNLETMLSEGRWDVIDALAPHDIGYHTWSHSEPPTVAQYLQDSSWSEGVAEFIRRESLGVAIIADVFRRVPACFGQGGGTWAPQAFGAMEHFKIPTYLSGNSFVSLDGQPFHYCNRLALSRLEASVSIGFDIHTETGWRRPLKEIESWIDKLKSTGGVISVSSHPCQWVTKEFWDAVNHLGGKWRAPDKLKKAAKKTGHDFQEGLLNFMHLLEEIPLSQEVRIVGVSQITAAYNDIQTNAEIAAEEILEICEKRVLDEPYFKTDYGYLSAAELFRVLVEACEKPLLVLQSRELEEGGPLATYGVRPMLGPERPPIKTDRKLAGVSRDAFFAAIEDVSNYVQENRRVPNEVWVAGVPIPPESFLATMAAFLVKMSRSASRLPSRIPILSGEKPFEQYAKLEYAEAAWKWPCFPKGFRADNLFELAKLQCWTIKPAVPAVSHFPHLT